MISPTERMKQSSQKTSDIRNRFQSSTPANSESNEDENEGSTGSQSFDQEKDYLRPPALSRQFLLSPPPSPPVGWEPPTEGQPMINYELIAALSRMVPGQPLELHPSEEDKPAIVVHICEDPVSTLFPSMSSVRIPQTQRPPVKCQPDHSSRHNSNQSTTA